MNTKELELTDIAVSTVQFILKRWWILLLLIIIGGVIGFFKYQQEDTEYHGEIIFRGGIVPAPVMINYINELGNYVNNQQFESFSEQVGLPLLTAQKLSHLAILGIYDNSEQHYLLTIHSVGSKEAIDSTIVQLNQYLTQNTYIAEELSMKEAQLHTEIKANNNQIGTLSNIQNSMANGGQNNILYADPAAVSQQIVMLESKNILLQKELDNLSVIQVVDKVIITKPASLARNIIGAVLVIFILGVALLLFVDLWQSIKLRL